MNSQCPKFGTRNSRRRCQMSVNSQHKRWRTRYCFCRIAPIVVRRFRVSRTWPVTVHTAQRSTVAVYKDEMKDGDHVTWEMTIRWMLWKWLMPCCQLSMGPLLILLSMSPLVVSNPVRSSMIRPVHVGKLKWSLYGTVGISMYPTTDNIMMTVEQGF